MDVWHRDGELQAALIVTRASRANEDPIGVKFFKQPRRGVQPRVAAEAAALATGATGRPSSRASPQLRLLCGSSTTPSLTMDRHRVDKVNAETALDLSAQPNRASSWGFFSSSRASSPAAGQEPGPWATPAMMRRSHRLRDFVRQ